MLVYLRARGQTGRELLAGIRYARERAKYLAGARIYVFGALTLATIPAYKV